MEKDNSIKEYLNGEVTITWESSKCTHSGNCVRGLKSVFDTKKRPWINPQGATSEEIVKQVQKCPSGALGYYHKDE